MMSNASSGKHFADFGSLTLSGSPPTRPPGAAWGDDSYIVSGTTTPTSSLSPTRPPGADLWEYDTKKNTWKRLELPPVPLPSRPPPYTSPEAAWKKLEEENARLKTRVEELEQANRDIWANYDYRCEQLHDIEQKLSGMMDRWEKHDKAAAEAAEDGEEHIVLTINETAAATARAELQQTLTSCAI